MKDTLLVLPLHVVRIKNKTRSRSRNTITRTKHDNRIEGNALLFCVTPKSSILYITTSQRIMAFTIVFLRWKFE